MFAITAASLQKCGQGDLHQAQELFEEARRKGYTEAAFGLGVLYNGQGDVHQTQELFE